MLLSLCQVMLSLTLIHLCEFVCVHFGAMSMSGCDFRHLCILLLPLLRVSAVLSPLSPHVYVWLKDIPVPIRSLNMLALPSTPSFFLVSSCLGCLDAHTSGDPECMSECPQAGCL